MNWYIGERINREILGNMRAGYGKQIVSRLATQLSWSHFVEVLPIKEPMQREFYLTVAASEHWSRNLMREKIDGMLNMRKNPVRRVHLGCFCVQKVAMSR